MFEVMGKADLISQANFSEEFKKHREQNKGKTLGDVVGLPDDVDKERIQRYLTRYDKKHPGEIKFHRDMARAQHQAQGGKLAEYGEVNKQAHGRVLFELPEEIGHWMEKAYPLMFRDKKHLHWFCKNFPELMIPPKY